MPRKPLPHDLVAQADRLSLEDLKLLVARLTEKIHDRELREKLDQPSPEAGWRPEYRKCGKSNCCCAAGGELHGPYWYRSVREGDRVFKQYWRKGNLKDIN